MWLEEKILARLTEGKVRFLPKRCIRVKNRFASCDKCRTACAAAAISFEEDMPRFEEEKCLACMRCTAHCPAGAFFAADATKFEREIFLTKAPVLHCERMAIHDGGIAFACLQAVTTEHLLLGVLAHGSIQIGYSTSLCRDCEKSSGAVFEELAAKARRAERLLKNGARVEIAEPEELRQSTHHYTRREFFHFFKEKAMAGLSGFTHEAQAPPTLRGSITQENGAAAFWRLYRQFQLEFREKARLCDLPYQLLQASGSCSGCGVCVKVCPAAALSFRRDAFGVRLTQDLRRCIGCGSCVDICPRKALSPSALPEISLLKQEWNAGGVRAEDIGKLDFVEKNRIWLR